MSTPAVPDSLAGEVVVSPVNCRRCGYNLYGLRADGQCPECGLETWETILHTVDPAASRLPRLRNPVAVGNALFALTIFLLACAVLLTVRPLALWIDSIGRPGRQTLAAWTPLELSIAAGLAGAVGLLFVARLAPPRGEEPGGAVWRDIWLLALGLGGWAALVMATGIRQLAGDASLRVGLLRLALPVAAIVGLLGLRGVLRTIGLRSREYRNARSGRQGIQAMVAAIIGVTVGEVIRVISGSAGQAIIGAVVASMSTLMLLIGLLYLVVNAWWIRRSLRRPPPGFDEVLGPPGQG